MFEALIQKLEAAIEWDEQLDRDIEDAIDGDGRRLGWGPYPYTIKIDAARGLLDRVLPGWSYRVARCAVSDDAWVMPDFNCPIHGERLRAELRQDIDWTDLTDVDLRPSGREATALCISILKALEILNAKSHQAPEAAPAEAGAEARPNGETSAPAEIRADGQRAQQKIEASVVDLTPIFDDHPFVARSTMLAALDAERGSVAREARRYASFYPEASDGRNTFVMFAEFVERRQEHPAEVFTVGDNTMLHVFKPSGLTNLHDLQAVLDAMEKALSGDEPVAAMTTDYLGCEYVSTDIANIENIASAGSAGPTAVRYLYDKPQQPAPSSPAREVNASKNVIGAAKAVLAQWDTSNWKLAEPTGKLMDGLRKAVDEAALSAAEPVSSIVPDHCSGTALVFDGGCLHVRTDGSGHIVVDEEDFKLEDDQCEGEHGPEGSVHWIARFPAGEMTALRDFLNGQDFPAPSVAVKELQWDEDGDNLKARMGDREWMLNITSDGKTWAGSTRPFVFGRNLTWSSVPNCSMVSLEAAKAACQADCQSRYAALSAQVQDVAVKGLFGPYAHLNGNRRLSEDEWTVEDNPIENTEEYFSIPLYAPVEPPFPSGSEKQDQNGKPLDLNITEEWFEKRAALEGDHEVGAGRRKLTASTDPTPEELVELHRLAHRIPEGWQLVPKEPTEEMLCAVDHDDCATPDAAERAYRAMLAAARAKQEGA